MGMADFKIGQTVYSKKLEWSQVSGTSVKERYGYFHGYISSSTTLTIRKARFSYICDDCGKTIAKGELHGSAFYGHYCLNCVTAESPEPQFKPLEK